MTTAHTLTPSPARGSLQRRHLARAAAAAVVLALAACGTAPSITIALDSASAALLRGAEIQVEVTLTRGGGASTDVTLTISGLPADVTAAFSPTTLSGSTLTSTLTLTATGATAEGNYDVTVTGAGAGLSDAAELALEVVSLSVTGRVVTVYDLPVAGLAVGSQGDTEITNANGEFELTGLSVPYDLSVWNAVDGWLHVFEGLTSDQLVVAPAFAMGPSGASASATVTGVLSGGVIPVAANQTVAVCVEGLDGLAIGCDAVTPTESSYSINVQWLDSPTRQVRIHALQVERDPSGLAVGYQGYATLTTTLSDGVPVVANLDLGSALPTTTVDVDIDSTDTLIGTLGMVQLGPELGIAVMVASGSATSVSALMPVISGASYSFAGLVSFSQFGWQAGITGSTASVSVAGLPHLTAPADLTTGVDAMTNFTVTNPTDGPVTFMWQAALGDLSIAVSTMDRSTRLPDLAPYGLAYTAGADFTWGVIGHGGTSPEDAVGAYSDYYRLIMILSGASNGLSGEGSLAAGPEDWGFTLAP